MPTALICTQADLDADLGHTLLWRGDMERHRASRLEEARMLAVAARPSIVVVDRDMPRSEKLVAQLREDPATRGLSIVVLARGDFDPGEVEYLEAGANAILRIPPGPEWDDRLRRLLEIPARKDARFPVQLAVSAESFASGAAFPAQALNLSVSGMLLECPAEVGVRDEIRFSFRLPYDSRDVTGSGVVVRQAGPGLCGVEFRKLEADGEARVRRFVTTQH